MQKFLIPSLILCSFFVVSCVRQETGNTTQSGNTVENTTKIDTNTWSTKVATEKNNWEYDTQKDEMRWTENKAAQTVSTNKVNFSAPYEGGSKMQIAVVYKWDEKKNYIIISVDRWQFDAAITWGKKISAKFDDWEIKDYEYATSGTLEYIQLTEEDGEKFFENLKKSKKVIVEAPFFSDGTKQFTFDIWGLNF